jgi:hypothetical protein
MVIDMAIYTRFGSEIKPVSKDGPWIVCEYPDDGSREGIRRREYLQTELRADDGWSELEKVLDSIPEIKQDPERGYVQPKQKVRY